MAGAGIEAWLATLPRSPWINLLQEAAAEYAADTGGAEMPSEHFLEWLTEWGREVRRRQSGVMLLTAHRAKGLEFDHVAVLDGGWEHLGKGEDPDAPRRLFYVAMTRARQTLTLARLNRRHALLDALPRDPCMLQRALTELPAPAPELARRHAHLGLADVDLSFAGRAEPHALVHRAIAALTVGSVVRLKRERERWILQDDNGVPVGRLARSYRPPEGMQCVLATVAAIVVWRQSDSDTEYQQLARCERWEVVVPRFVFAPSGH